jgi:tetratricopeptide (TPR) repeat protein
MSNSVASASMAPSTFIGDETVYSQNFEQGYQKSDYLRNAYYYLSHRKSLLSLWQNLSYQDSAFDETVPTDTIPPMDLVSPTGDTNMRELEYAQWDLTGNVVTNLGQLYEHAEFVKPVFESSLKHIASECNLSVREPQDGRETTAESGLLLCSPKMADRATEKAREEYSKVDPGPACAWIYDILRASFVCDTEEQIRNVYDLIGFDSNFTVIRVKNRFKTPTTAGFRDILINVMTEDIGPTGNMTHFICEIQITHIDLRQYEIENDTRALYRFFRPLTTGTQQSQDAKIRLLEKIVSTTSPILNAVGVSPETIDADITEAIQVLSKEVLESDKLDDTEDWIDVLESVAEFALAEKMQRRLIKLEMKRYGENNQMVSDSLLKLGGLLKAQNELDQAAAVYQAAAVMKNELLGEYDAQVADALFCMAEVRTMQGKYDAAVPLHEQVLLIRRKLYFRDNPDIAVSLTKLAEIMEAQDNHPEAISYYTQALAVWQAVYGENSPFVAACMNSLALLLDSTGKSNEAKSMFERCVAICKVLYGEDHTSVASAMNNLALCLKKLGEYEEAYQLYEQALAIRRARYGEKHPAVATTLNNLGLLLKQQQRYEDAKQLYLQALQIRREVLGANHVDVASSLSNLALLHEAMGNLGEALFLHENTRTMRITVLGPEHPTVASTLVNMGLVHKKLKNLEDARAMFEKAIAIYELYPVQTANGASPHPEIAVTRGYLKNLDELADDEGHDDDDNSLKSMSESIASKSVGHSRNTSTMPVGPPAVKLKVRVYRSEHEKLAFSLRTMAVTLQDRGELEAAQPFFEQSLGLLLAISGGKPDSSELCAEGIVLLALLYRELGRYKLCYDLLEKALEQFYNIFQTKNKMQYVTTMREVGKTLNLQRQFSDCKQTLAEALTIAQSLEDSVVEQTMILCEMGISSRDTNDLDVAKSRFEEALQMRVTALGETHHLVAAALIELGQVNRLKASFTTAREYYEDALKICIDVSENENGRCNKDIALTHRRIGLAYKEENTWLLAFTSLQKSIDMYSSPKSGLSADSLELASTLYESAHVAIRLPAADGGGLESAVGMLARCLEIREKRLGSFHRDTAQTKLDLAVKLRMNSRTMAILSKNAYMRSSNVNGSRFEQEKFVQLAVGNTDASFDSSLAVILLENAAEAFEQANLDAQLSGSRDGYNLRELANVYVELGGILVEEQMWMTAAPVYEKLLDTYRKIYSRNTTGDERDIVKDANVLALLESDHAATERTSEDAGHSAGQSNPLLHGSNSVVSGHSEAAGEGGGRQISRVFHPDMQADCDETALALSTAAFVCMRCNRLKRSKDLFQESIEILQRIGQGATLVIADVHSNFGELREREKKYNKAKEQHDLALHIRLKLVGDDHPLVADSLEEIGQLRLQATKWDKAEKDFAETIRIRRKHCAKLRRRGSADIQVPSACSSGEKSVFAQAIWASEMAEADGRLAYSLADYAYVFAKKRDFSKARELLEETIAVRQNIKVGFNAVTYSGVIVQLSKILIDMEVFGETKPLLVEALQIREDYFGTEHKLVVEVLHILAVVLDKLDEIGDAQKVLEQALAILIKINHTEFNEDVALTYSKLGMLFFQSQNYPLSITYFKKALEIWMKKNGIESSQVTDAMLNLAFAYKKNDEVDESRNNYEQAAAILRRRHGYNNADVASVLASLSSLAFYEAKFQEALDYSKQVLRIRKKINGRDNPEVINTTANQAIIYERLLMYKNAHKLHLKVLKWREANLSPEDILIAFSLIAMSDTFRRMGDIEEAYAYNERALSQLRANLGHTHEATIQRVAVSGELYRVQGRYVDAERQLRYAVDATLVESNNVLSPGAMPMVLQLAGVARVLGKYVESERWYRSVLGAQEGQYGQESAEVACTLSSLGCLCMDQFRLKEASEYLDEALEIRSSLLGDRHPDTASSLNNLGSLLDMLGRHAEAKAKFEQALQIRVDVFGERHPSVAQVLNNIASLQSALGKYDEAETLFNLSHSIITKLFGGEHPAVAVSMNNLGGLLDVKGEFVRSMPIHEECFQIRKETLGQGHLLCAQSMNNIGSSFLLQNKLKEASAMYQEAVNIRRRVHGGDKSVDIAEGFSNQASVYMAEGRYQIAAKLQRQASQIMEEILGNRHPSSVNVKGNLGISCRRNGETTTGNELLREAAEFLVSHHYPEHHPWVVKFSNEARAHGEYGGPALVGGLRPEGDAALRNANSGSIHESIHESVHSRQGPGSGKGSVSSRKDVVRHKPVRVEVDPDHLEGQAEESLASASVDDSLFEAYERKAFSDCDSIDSRSESGSAAVYYSQPSKESRDSANDSDSDSQAGEARAGEVVRVVPGKGKPKKRRSSKGEGEGEAALPLFPRMLAKIPFLSKKKGSQMSSGGLGEEEVKVTRVVKKKGPYQPGAESPYGETPERPLVPRIGSTSPRRGEREPTAASDLFGQGELDDHAHEDEQEQAASSGEHAVSSSGSDSTSGGGEGRGGAEVQARARPASPVGDMTTYSPFNADIL